MKKGNIMRDVFHPVSLLKMLLKSIKRVWEIWYW